MSIQKTSILHESTASRTIDWSAPRKSTIRVERDIDRGETEKTPVRAG